MYKTTGCTPVACLNKKVYIDKGDILYSEVESILNQEASAVAIYCFRPHKSGFITNLIERTIIDISQLGCPKLAELAFQVIGCHNKSK
jgi:hypothetical protein